MMNQVVIIGRVETKGGESNGSINVKVPRGEGTMTVHAFWPEGGDGPANIAEDRLQDGCLVGIKGSLGKKNRKMVVLIEKITFLS